MHVRRCAALTAAAFALQAACVSDRTAGPPENSVSCDMPLDALRLGAVPVLIRDFAFVPDTVRIRAGGTVVWVNCENATAEAHTATAQDGDWSSPLLRRGEAYMQTFGAAGAHEYFCLPHSAMRGVVLVD